MSTRNMEQSAYKLTMHVTYAALRAKDGLTMRGADRAYRRSLYRGFLVLTVDLPSTVALQTRRGGSR